MKRTASAILFLASASLLASRFVSPALSAPEAGAPRLEMVEQTPPAVAEVNAEVDRLRDRTAVAPNVPVPARDPFSFGRAPERVRTLPPSAPDPERAPIDVRGVPVLPRLVAILSSSDPSASPTAVFAVGEDVELKRAGDELGVFRVDAVSADATVLVDRVTHDAVTVSLH